jgi:hypothetical protein
MVTMVGRHDDDAYIMTLCYDDQYREWICLTYSWEVVDVDGDSAFGET